MARDRARVLVTLADGGTLSGAVARVGANFIDIAEARDTAEPGRERTLTAVPLEAVVLVRRAPG